MSTDTIIYGVMVLRQRIRNVITFKNVKVLDAFPKVEAACQEGSPVSGAGKFHYICFARSLYIPILVTVLSYLVIICLIFLETRDYFNSNIVYKFLPDTDFDAKLSAKIDLTIAMPCQSKFFLNRVFNDCHYICC